MLYWPGLEGGFLFDDFPNLSPMGNLGGVRDWETFSSFVLNGFAGPLGRPVALASFLLDANNWPAAPRPFKLTNLWIHLLAGLALCWATLNLLRVYGVPERKAQWGAVLNMAFWLLHPYMVSTTLYVVQRMAQLEALFAFAGLAAYLHGRLLLPRQHLAGYIWMSLALVVGTGLAAFSKENGLLLPLLVLVVEWCVPKHSAQAASATVPTNIERPDWRWRALFLWLPALAVLGYLLSRINLSPDLWPARNFNQTDRLLTESRILWEYLWHLYVPRIEGLGLFQDGLVVSTNWLKPATTMPAIVGLALLLLLALWARTQRWGVWLALALLFFFASHLVESTVIGLELYFEHRNYAASAFLFLPLAMGLLWLAQNSSRFVACGAVLAILALLSALTWQRTSLWSDSAALENYWAVASPNSPRAQNHLAVQLFKQGRVDEGFVFLHEASSRLPESSLLSMQWLLQKVVRRQVTAQDFHRIRAALPHQRFDAQAIMGLRMVVESLIEPDASWDDRYQTLLLLDLMHGLPQYQRVGAFRRIEPYLRGLLLASMGDADAATEQFLQAMKRFRETDAALAMVAHMGNAGYPQQGLVLLGAARQIYEDQPSRNLKRPRNVYDLEFVNLEAALRDDLREAQSPASEPH